MLGRLGRRDTLALAALGLVGIGIPLLMSATAGAIGVPGNDDWVYMRAAGSLFRTGSVDMPGHTAAFIGQLVMVQPMLWLSGGNPWAFTAFGLVMASIGVASTYLLARRFVGTGSAAMVVLLLVTFPGFARGAASFMTDVPACALAVLCLLLGTRWLQGEGRRLTLVASLGAGLLAVSIREFALAAPVAILVAAWARSRPDERAWLAGVSGILAAGVLCVLVVAVSTSGRGTLVAPDLAWMVFLGPAFVTFAAVLLPAAALGMGRRMATLGPEPFILGAGLVLCLMVAAPDGPIVGNLWTPSGLAGDRLLSGTRDPVIGEGAWALSGQLALFAAILVAAMTLRWVQRNFARVSSLSTATAQGIRIAQRREAPLVLFLVVYAAGLVAFAPMGPFFDRYLYPIVPTAAILILRGGAQPSRFGRSQAFAHGAFAWLAASAFVIAANSFAYDAARHRAGDAAVAMGYDARTVDAGLEWVGLHARGVGTSGDGGHGVTWYYDRLASFPACAVVSNSPMDDDAFRLVRADRSAYLQFLFVGPAEPLYLYGAVTDECPPPPAAIVATAP